MTGGVDRRLAEDLRATYHRHAQDWDAARPRAGIEDAWLARLTYGLSPGAAVLDLGCGAGDPVAGKLRARGMAVTGVDFAPAMLALARARWPDMPLIQMDMRVLELPARFDAIVSWDAFFHLTPEAQRRCLPRLARHLRPGGRLLLTVGPAASEVVGQVAGAPVYHASLSPEGYASALAACGCEIIDFRAEDPQADRHSVLLARKTGGVSSEAAQSLG